MMSGETTSVEQCSNRLLIAIKAGLGLPYKKGNPESIHEILRLTFIAEFLYTTLLCFVKFSVLAFYWRTFNSKFTRWLIYILGAITTIWGLAVVGHTEIETSNNR